MFKVPTWTSEQLSSSSVLFADFL